MTVVEQETALGDELGFVGFAPAPAPAHADRQLLDRLIDDLTTLVASPEGRWSKRNLNAFVDALKRIDYVNLELPDAEA